MSHGKGSARNAVNYLLQEHDHTGEVRESIEVLRGDPDMVATVADSSKNTQKYTSGVISWAPEEKPTKDEINAVMDDWEELAFSGIAPENRCYTAVLHSESNGGVHVHTLTARTELSTGKALNIAPPGHQKDFDAFRDAWNHEKGWARPDDPARKRALEQGTEAFKARDKTAITEYMMEQAALGYVTNGQEVRKKLATLGEITRDGKDYVSVKPEGANRAIRLKGGVFEREWSTDQQLNREARKEAVRGAGRGGAVDPSRAREARRDLGEAVQRRAKYNFERYEQSQHISPEPRPRAETAQQPEERKQSESVVHERKPSDDSLKFMGVSGRDDGLSSVSPRWVQDARSQSVTHGRRRDLQRERADVRSSTDIGRKDRGDRRLPVYRDHQVGTRNDNRIRGPLAELSGRASAGVERLRGQVERIRKRLEERNKQLKERFKEIRKLYDKDDSSLRPKNSPLTRRDDRVKAGIGREGSENSEANQELKHQYQELEQQTKQLDKAVNDYSTSRSNQEITSRNAPDVGPAPVAGPKM